VSQFTEEEIRTAATSLRPTATVEQIESVDPGKNTVYAVDYADREAILKIGTESPERVRAEPAIVEFVSARATLPVPTVIASGEEALSAPYTLFERVTGKTVDDLSPGLSPATLEQVLTEAGHFLGRLHAATGFDGVGPLVPHEAGLEPETPNTEWQSLLGRVAKGKIDQLGDLFDPYREALRNGIDRMLDDWSPPSRVDPVLAHMDYRPANLVLSPSEDQVTEAVLDWGGAAAAPAGYELAHVEALTRGFPHPASSDTLRERFRGGYREAQEVDDVPDVPPVYRVNAQLRLAKHLELIADSRPDTSLETVAEERLDQFRELGVLR
jgi:Ser/Thr protein kinase RdoA (MazF antagonist)